MKTIGDKIREVLEAKDMKQADLVRATGISSGLISAIINNQRTSVMVDTLQKLSKALGVHSAYFLEGEPAGTPDILSTLSEEEQKLFGSEDSPWMFSIMLRDKKASSLPSQEKWASLRKLSKEAKEEGLPLDKVLEILDMILDQ